MKDLPHIFLLVLVTIFFIDCVSTQVDVVEESKAPVDLIVDVKQSVADPFHWRFTLFINEEEVLETLSFSEKISKTKYQGHETSMNIPAPRGEVSEECELSIIM